MADTEYRGFILNCWIRTLFRPEYLSHVRFSYKIISVSYRCPTHVAIILKERNLSQINIFMQSSKFKCYEGHTYNSVNSFIIIFICIALCFISAKQQFVFMIYFSKLKKFKINSSPDDIFSFLF